MFIKCLGAYHGAQTDIDYQIVTKRVIHKIVLNIFLAKIHNILKPHEFSGFPVGLPNLFANNPTTTHRHRFKEPRRKNTLLFYICNLLTHRKLTYKYIGNI